MGDMKKKLLSISALTLLIGMVAAFLLAIPLVENLYLRQVKADCRNTLLLLAEQPQRAMQDPEQFANDYAALFEKEDQSIRITLMDEQGNVLGDSRPEEGLPSHADRPEFQQALREDWGFAQRRSAIVGVRYLYAAHHSGSLVYRIALPLSLLRRTNWMMWGSALLGLLVGFFLTFMALRRTVGRYLRPVDAMINASQTISQGNFEVHLPEAADEMGQLSKAFNAMAQKLTELRHTSEASHKWLHAILQGLDDGVLAVDTQGRIFLLTERAKALLGVPAQTPETLEACGANYLYLQQLLQKAIASGEGIHGQIRIVKDEEKILHIFAAPMETGERSGALAVITDVTRVLKLEEVRREFVANVTHELKTPMTSIRGYVALLKDKRRDEETRQQFYEIIEIEVERLQALIQDLLQLSDIENAVEEPAQHEIALQECAQSVLESLRPLADKSGVTLRAQLDPKARMRADPLRIRQLLSNLLENAIKYNHPGGEVDLRIIHERDMNLIRVSDTGVGIPKEHQTRVFERFYRVDKGRSRELGGTGLGLSIVKHIVSLYNGNIVLESETGKGSVFMIRLP